VTLKTGVMMINSALITGINYTIIYSQKTVVLHCNMSLFLLYF